MLTGLKVSTFIVVLFSGAFAAPVEPAVNDRSLEPWNATLHERTVHELDGASSFPYLLQSVKDGAFCIHPDGGRASQNAELLFWNDCDDSRADLLFVSLDAGDGKFVLQSCTSADRITAGQRT